MCFSASHTEAFGMTALEAQATGLVNIAPNYGGFTDFGYSKIKWNKKTILKSIDDNSIDEYYIKSMSDYLHINIFILDTASKNLNLSSDYYPNRKHYVIYKIEEQYYPIFIKDK